MKAREVKKIKKLVSSLIGFAAVLCLLLGYFGLNPWEFFQKDKDSAVSSVTLENIPAYSGSPYVELNGNVPCFEESEHKQYHLSIIVNWILWGGVRWHMPIFVWNLCQQKNGDRLGVSNPLAGIR